jgi:hypothetical protein
VLRAYFACLGGKKKCGKQRNCIGIISRILSPQPRVSDREGRSIRGRDSRSKQVKRIMRTGGEGGIRTPDTLSGMPVFKTGVFNRSTTSPANTVLLQSLEYVVDPAEGILEYICPQSGRRPQARIH